MCNCYWGRYNEGTNECDDFACNGKCYREENSLALNRRRKNCIWQRNDLSKADIVEHQEQETYRKEYHQREREESRQNRKQELKEPKDEEHKEPLKQEEHKRTERVLNYWEKIMWGGYCCTRCGDIFPPSIRKRRICPNCKAVMEV